MGIKRKDNKYRKPKKPFDGKRIQEEKQILNKFGLKNKKEIWKAEFQINILKAKAKQIMNSDEEKKKNFVEKLKRKCFDINNVLDVLDLTKENWLERRLQTFVLKKGLAKTIKEARQLITHKKIIVGKRIVNIPSYFVTKDEENKIKLKEEKNG